MEGRTVSHYRVLEKLGGGGMGVVYRAQDVRLGRDVALKFLPSDLTGDAEANERFVQEAKAASALDHPNICTIYEIGETDDGQIFLAMAYYDGETLEKQVDRGPMPVERALNVAAAVAAGLIRAHESGIVHRDIKPANVIVTARGDTKILDFGIAKLAGKDGLTRTGTTLGTLAYMAPEQLSGGPVDQRADVWSLAVLLYELLTGQRPFQGEQAPEVIAAILNKAPTPVRAFRPDVPEAVEVVIERALQKAPDARYASANAFLDDLTAAPSAEATGSESAGARSGAFGPAVRLTALAVVLVGLTLGIWSWQRGRNAAWARTEALPEIERLVQADRYAAAFVLAEQAETYVADDPLLGELWSRLARPVTITTSPADVAVSVAFYKEDGGLTLAWRPLGRTPVAGVRLPREATYLRLEKAGFETLETLVGRGASSLTFDLDEAGTVPPDMVRVPEGTRRIALAGFDDYPRLSLPSYLIGRHEVTNREYQAFVDAGAYRDRAFWHHTFVDQVRELTWDEAMGRFHDRSGRPGPATWEGGTYPAGEDDHPVAGVSWYEAAAYAEFTGRSLPTVYHWLGAGGTGQARYILPHSNFSRTTSWPVGSGQPGVLGTFDMAGNVKEWCWNALGSARYILGAGWNDPTHVFFEADASDPFDRSETNGVRTVNYLDATAAELEAARQPIERTIRDYTAESPVTDDVYRAFAARFAYDSLPLAVEAGPVDDSSPYWRREIVEYDAAYGGERIPAHLFVPKNVEPPYQTVVYYPGSGTIRTASSDRMPVAQIDLIVKSGRAVLWPIYKDTFERATDLEFTDPNPSRAYVEHVTWWIKDLRRSLDYLDTRPDLDLDKIAFFGFSWGARLGNIALAVEPRLRLGMLISGGFPLMDSQPEVREINFAPRVRVPVLLLTGRHDAVFPYETSQKFMEAFLGPSGPDKKWVPYEASHGLIGEMRGQVYGEIVAWLDAHFGPVS